jgi:hypothetical protein
MHGLNQITAAFLGLFTSLIMWSFFVFNSAKIIFFIIALTCFFIAVLSHISSRSYHQKIINLLNFLDEIRPWYFILFLNFYGLSMTLIKNNFITVGGVVVLADYAIFYYWVGKILLGKDVLRPICDKLNIFIPSPKLPKEF